MYLTDNIFVFGDRHFQIFLLGTDPAIIIEAGVSYVIPLIERQVEQLHKPLNIDYAVIMHAHFDHICGVPGLKKIFPGMKIAAAEEAAKVLQRPKIIAKFFNEDAAMLEGCGDGPCHADFITGVPKTIEVDKIIQAGEQWELNNMNIKFYQAPGHSYDSIVAHIPEQEVLFCSDSTGFPIDDRSIFPIFFTGYADYLATIEMMRNLSVNILACAHEQIIHGAKQVKEYLNLAVAEAEKVQSYVAAAWRRGEGQESISADLFNNYYTGNLRIYSEQNIKMCCDLLTTRSLQAAGVQI